MGNGFKHVGNDAALGVDLVIEGCDVSLDLFAFQHGDTARLIR